MIHPKVQDLFDEKLDQIQLFSWICEKSKNTEKIDEFIKFHINANSQVIREITKINQIDFSHTEIVRKWAKQFLDNYDEKIRELRNISNQVFDTFQFLKKNIFEKLIAEYPNQEKDMRKMMNVFLNQNGLLIGKIIFTYREPWFLANQINNPDFKLNTIGNFKNWEEENFSNIIKLQNWLEGIHSEILKWKER